MKEYKLTIMPKSPNLIPLKLSKLLLIYWKEDQSSAQEVITVPYELKLLEWTLLCLEAQGVPARI